MIARVKVCPPILLSKCTPRTYISKRNLFSSAVRLSDEAPLDSKAYSKTLLLPKTSFPLWSNPPEVENQYRSLTCDSLYRWQVREGFLLPEFYCHADWLPFKWDNAKGPLFVLHDGPPYANGDLHMGALLLFLVLRDFSGALSRPRLEQDSQGHHQPLSRFPRTQSPVRCKMRCHNSAYIIDTVSYVPGWDCHGLPIENKALQDLNVRFYPSWPVSFE